MPAWHSTLMDPSEMFQALDRRVYTLEQLLSSVDGPWSSSVFNSIDIIPTDPNAQPLHIDTTSDSPTGLALTWNAFFDNLYVDVSWVAPVSDTAQSYTVEWAKKVGGVYQLVNAQGGIVGNTVRVERLEPNTTYGFRVYGVNAIGISSVPIPSVNFQDIAIGQDATQPGAPTGVSITSTIRGLFLRWNANTEIDVARGNGWYKVEISTNAGFTAIVKTDYTSATVYTTSDLNPNVQYWARVYAIDQSGNMSAASATASTTTELVITNYVADFAVTNSKIANLAVDNAKIANLAVDDSKIANLSAAKVTFGVMSGDRIDLNTLNANRIATSSLTTQTITLAGGSLIAGNPPTSGVLFNSQGIRAYSGGVLTLTIDSSGTISLTGNINSGSNINGSTITGGSIIGPLISTANTGRRTALGPTILSGSGILMYSGIATETTPAQMGVSPFGTQNQLIISTGQSSGQSDSSIQMYSEDSAGASGYIDFTANQYTFYGGAFDLRFNIAGTIRLNANTSITGNMVSDVWMNYNVLYLCELNNQAHGLYYTAVSQPTPTVGNQIMDGPLLYGNSSVGLTARGYLGLRIYNDGNAQNRRVDTYYSLYYVSSQSFSSIKTKVASSIRGLDMNYADQLMQLRPVRFKSKGIDRTRFGLIAEEVSQHLPDVVWPGHGPEEEELPAIEYDAITALLILEAQNQRSRVEKLESELAAMAKLVDAFTHKP